MVQYMFVQLWNKILKMGAMTNDIKDSKVAIFSDLHLGLYGNSEDWHSIAMSWVEWIATELEQRKISDIFFLGDFFHNRAEISVQTIHVASKILERLDKFNIIMVVGNHDAYYKNRSDIHSLGLLRGHKNLTIVDENLEVDAFGKKLLFVPWNSDIPDKNYDYIFGHFEIVSFRMNNYKLCEHGVSVFDILTHTNQVFSGHFHTKSCKTYNEGTIRYVGNCFSHDFNDYGDTKGYYILDIMDGDLEFVENTISPRYEKIFLSKIKSYKDTDISNNFVKLIVDIDATDKQVEKVQTYIQKFKPHHLHTEYNTVSKTVVDVEELDSIDLWSNIEEFVGQIQMADDMIEDVTAELQELYDSCK